MGGENVALGYFKRPDSTDFFQEDGRQWIKTGDVAEVHPDGAFKIIGKFSMKKYDFGYPTTLFLSLLRSKEGSRQNINRKVR